MKCKFGLIVTDGAGKLGGHLVSENKYGKNIRENKRPVQKYSKKQTAARQRMTTLSSSWRGLTGAEIYAWNSEATNWMTVNRFGQLVEMSGKNLFVKLNSNIEKVGGSSITVPPKKNIVSRLTNVSLQVINDIFYVTYESTGELENEMILFSLTKPLSPGVGYVQDQFVDISYFEVNSNKEFDLGEDYIEHFGTPGNGKKIWIKATIINKITGEECICSISSAIVNEIDIEDLLKNNTVGWFDYTDESTITKDGADLVQIWGDKSGLGHDLIQNTDIKKPLFTSNGILFDGINDSMKTSGFEYVQPMFFYIILKQITNNFNDAIFDGYNNVSCMFLQTGVSAGLRLYAGSFGLANTQLALDTYGIARILFNYLDSSLQINKTEPTLGDRGNNDMNGITIGSRGEQSSYFANIEVKEIICRNVADTELFQDVIYNYLTKKYDL